MAIGDLFTSSDAPEPGKAPDSAFLVTNHLNLMYMLAAGLLMPPAGFGDKYYRDPLECFPAGFRCSRAKCRATRSSRPSGRPDISCRSSSNSDSHECRAR